MEITPLPPAPSSASPSTFAALADAFVEALPVMVDEVNSVVGFLSAMGLSAVPLTWDNATTDSDPGLGCIRFNNAFHASTTQLFIDVFARGGSDLTAFLASLDDSSDTVKGVITVAKASDPANYYASFMVTGSVTAAAGYYKVPVSPLVTTDDTLSFLFADGDALILACQRSGGAFLPAMQAQSAIAGTTGGSGTAYTLTPSPAITSYAEHQSFFVRFHAVSGASPTLAINGVATPPNLVKQLPTGAFTNIELNDIPVNHRSRVTLLSATQALVERLPQLQPSQNTPVALSGTSVTWSNIPAAANEIEVLFYGMSTAGTTVPYMQVGDSGGLEASGYSSTVGSNDGSTSQTSSAIMLSDTSWAASHAASGRISMRKITSTEWSITVTIGRSDAAVQYNGYSHKTLTGGPLDRIWFGTAVDAFDGGSWVVNWR